MNASGYLSQDEGVPSGSHLGIQVEQRLKLSYYRLPPPACSQKALMMLQFQVNVLFFTMELGDLKHLVRYFYIDACLAFGLRTG